MSPDPNNKYGLFYNLFLGMSESVLKSEEFRELQANLNRADRRKIGSNYTKIADQATRLFIEEFQSKNKNDYNDADIQRCIKLAVLAVLEDGR